MQFLRIGCILLLSVIGGALLGFGLLIFGSEAIVTLLN